MSNEIKTTNIAQFFNFNIGDVVKINFRVINTQTDELDDCIADFVVLSRRLEYFESSFEGPTDTPLNISYEVVPQYEYDDEYSNSYHTTYWYSESKFE